jgi:hypothetical membrane protein
MKNFLKQNWLKVSIWAGMVGPIFFVTVFTLEGWLRPGYHTLSMYVSDLSIGKSGWIQITNFIISGILIFIFSLGVAHEFQSGKASKAGPILLSIIGICLIASGPFITDPTVIFTNQSSWHGILHGLFGAIVFSLAPISCLIFYRRFRKDPIWRKFSRWTILACTIITIAVVFMKIAEFPSTPVNLWAGLIQRIALITYFAWVFTFALVLRKNVRGRVI